MASYELLEQLSQTIQSASTLLSARLVLINSTNSFSLSLANPPYVPLTPSYDYISHAGLSFQSSPFYHSDYVYIYRWGLSPTNIVHKPPTIGIIIRVKHSIYIRTARGAVDVDMMLVDLNHDRNRIEAEGQQHLMHKSNNREV